MHCVYMLSWVCYFYWHLTTCMTAFNSLLVIPDKRGYPQIIFLISPWKHMLWVLIRSAWWGTSNEYPQLMFICRNKKKISTFFGWKKKAHTWSYVYLHNCEICITFAVFLKKLRQMVTLGRFSAIFDNGDNFCDLVCAFLHIKPPSEKWSTHAEQIVSF